MFDGGTGRGPRTISSKTLRPASREGADLHYFRPIEQRVTGSAVAAAVAASHGAAILRVHDVAETRDAMAVMQTLTQGTQ